MALIVKKAAERAGLTLRVYPHLLRHAFARQDAHMLDQTEGEATGEPGQRLVAPHGQQWLECGRNLAVDEMLQTATDLFGNLGTGFLVDEGLDRAVG